MQIDTLTLMIPGCFATGLAGVFLMGAWFQLKSPALAWWTAAALLNALGLGVLIAGLAADAVPLIMSGVGLTVIVPALVWAGVRSFNNRRAPIVLILAGLAAWIATGGIAQFAGLDHQKLSTAVSFAAWYVYFPATIWELWSSREEKLRARWPLAGFFALHALVFLGGSFDALSGVLILDRAPPLFSWFGLTHFETIAFAMGSSIFMVLLCKERLERGYIEAAGVDPLTGVANRRALCEQARRLFSRCNIEGAPLSVVLFDLDRFKLVNDTFGHQGGDYVLRRFADTVRALMRPNDLFGRYGGEEFVLVLPDVSVEGAYIIAERARHAFAASHELFEGRPIAATVSAGIALADPAQPLEHAIAAADKAMYVAKASGRNRVHLSANQTGPEPETGIVRRA